MFVRGLAALAFKQQTALFFLVLPLLFMPRLVYAQSPISANVTVIKKLNPPTDPGLFNLQVNGADLVTDIGNDGSNSTTVTANNFSVGETSGTGTNLTNYISTISCVNNSANDVEIASGPGPTLNNIPANDGDQITCTITNTRKGQLTLTKVYHQQMSLENSHCKLTAFLRAEKLAMAARLVRNLSIPVRTRCVNLPVRTQV